jgi:hypothetical protein
MRNTNLWQGVVGYWSATAGPSGYRLLDRSGRGNHGTLTNMDAATDWVIDGGRYALDFDGTNDQVVILPTRVFGSVSVSLWLLSRANTSGKRIFCDRQDGAGGFDIFIDASNNIGLYLGNSAAQISTPVNSLAANVWNHLVVSCGPAGVQIFINGRLSASSASNFTIGQSASNLFLGRLSFSPAGTFFDGLLDDVFVVSTLINLNSARQLYQIGRGGMLTPRRRRRAYFAGVSGLRRRLLLTGQV